MNSQPPQDPNAAATQLLTALLIDRRNAEPRRISWEERFSDKFLPLPGVDGVLRWSLIRFGIGFLAALGLHWIPMLHLWISLFFLIGVACHAIAISLIKEPRLRTAVGLQALLPLVGLLTLFFLVRFVF